MGILCVQRMQGWEVQHPHVGQQRHCPCHKGILAVQKVLCIFQRQAELKKHLKAKGEKNCLLVLILLNSKESLKIPLFSLKEF